MTETINNSIFLNDGDIKKLTGCTRKSEQIDTLRSQGVLFFINKAGKPVVPKSAITGSTIEPQPETWNPNIISR